MVCLVIELRAHRRHRAGVTTAQGTSHPLVRRLVASIVLVASSAAVSATAAEAAQPVASHATFVSRVAADADALRQLADQAPEAHVAIAPKVGNDVQAKLGLRYIVQPPHSGNYDSLWLSPSASWVTGGGGGRSTISTRPFCKPTARAFKTRT